MTKTLSVAAIENGTVIDHIPQGQACPIVELLGLEDTTLKVTVGLNLPSKRLKLKDLIKIENHNLEMDAANQIAIFAPEASINIIKNFEVVEKLRPSLPSHISGVFICPNAACISNAEQVESYFMLEDGKHVQLTCKFCEKSFDRNQVSVTL